MSRFFTLGFTFDFVIQQTIPKAILGISLMDFSCCEPWACHFLKMKSSKT